MLRATVKRDTQKRVVVSVQETVHEDNQSKAAVKSKLGSYFLPESQYVDAGLALTFIV